MHNYFLELKDSATKNFQLDVRGMNEQEALFYYAEDRHKRKTVNIIPLSLYKKLYRKD